MRKLFRKETELGVYNIAPIMEDELYISHLLRTAAVNALKKNERFFLDLSIYAGDLGGKIPGTDIGIPSAKILRLNSADPFAEYRKMTLFNVLAPLTERNRLQYMISDAFYPRSYKHKIPRTTVQRNKIDVRVCPACARMEIREYGYYWLHRKHNVPGVEVCPEHGCRLVKVEYPYIYKAHTIHAARLTKMRVPICSQVAQLAAWFIDNAPDITLEDIRGIIRSEVLKRAKSAGGLDKAINAIIKASGGRVTRQQIESLACTAGGNNSKRHPKPAVVLTLLALLSTTDAIAAAASVPDPREQMFRKYASDCGYSLVGEYHRSLILLRHKKCGTVFPSTPFALSNGWVCPECGAKMTKEGVFRHVFETVSAGEYEMLSEYSGNEGELTLKHVCGRTFSVKARSFLYENAQCPCKRIFSPATADRMIPFVTGKRYGILEPYNPFDKTVLVRHDCGSTGRYNLARFLAGERCPVCNDTRKETVEPKTIQRERKLEYFRNRASENERSLILLDELKLKYGRNDLILREDLEDNTETRGRIAALVEEGRLMKYGPGAYALEGSTLAFEDIIEKRYLGDIGYMYGDTFAYQLGLASKPDVFVVISNKAGNAIGRTVVYNDGVVVLKRARVPLDKSNVVLLSVFDFLLFIEHYDGAAQKVRDYIIGRLGNLPELSEFDRLIARYGYRSVGRYKKLIRLVYGGNRCAA